MKDEISKAIGAHGMWKTRLRNAISSGVSEVPIEKIQVDNQCDFGKWLYGPSMWEAKSTEHYRKVKDLHAQFHKVAAKVGECAIKGKKEEAEALMGVTGEFGTVSAQLTQAMMNWAKSL